VTHVVLPSEQFGVLMGNPILAYAAAANKKTKDLAVSIGS
jgi:hypothetical protein